MSESKLDLYWVVCLSSLGWSTPSLPNIPYFLFSSLFHPLMEYCFMSSILFHSGYSSNTKIGNSPTQISKFFLVFSCFYKRLLSWIYEVMADGYQPLMVVILSHDISFREVPNRFHISGNLRLQIYLISSLFVLVMKSILMNGNMKLLWA